MTEVNKPIIGRSCELTFVGFSNEKVPAKIDTGAYHSSVHAENIYVDDNDVLHFTLFSGHPVTKEFAAETYAEKYKTAEIENSFGDREARYEVELEVEIDGRRYKTPFTLANRSKKVYPVLLGRLLLNHNFLVDTAQTTVDRKQLKQKFEEGRS